MGDKLERVDIDMSWVGKYKSTNLSGGFVTRGSPTAYMEVPKTMVDDITDLAQGFLYGALYAQGKVLGDVTFHPADHRDYVNHVGEPVYVFETKTHYELETHFS